MTMKGYRVLVGAEGWQHPQWVGEFYPEDLPAEWQLGFYSNEFRVALIPAEAWAEVATQGAAWLSNSATGLAFIVEIPESHCTDDKLQHNLQRLTQFGDRLLGILLPANTLHSWPAWCQTLIERYLVCIDAGADITTIRALLARDKRLGFCWDGAEYGELLQHGKLAIARIQSKDLGLRQLRMILETVLAAQDGERYLTVMFKGSPPSVTVMRQAMTLLDMM